MRKDDSTIDTSSPAAGSITSIDRRCLIAASAATAAFSAASQAYAAPGGNSDVLGDNPNRRAANALRLRISAAQSQRRRLSPRQRANGDDGLYPDFRASFSKSLPHNEFGEVSQDAYQSLLTALQSGNGADFERIPLGGTARLANPQGAYRFVLSGVDGQATWMRPAPAFASDETAAEMAELYWKAICRDVPFADYNSSDLIQAAADDLNAGPQRVGPLENGAVTPSLIFRGETTGDLTGPYVSQFLWSPFAYGNLDFQQRYGAPRPALDYMTDPASWLAVQRGGGGDPLLLGSPRYINDARALGEYVHQDFSFQAYLNAALILVSLPEAASASNPYAASQTQDAFVNFGAPDVLDAVTRAGNLALTGAWYQKWLVHRRLRPEVYGGRLHYQMTGDRDYGLPEWLGFTDGVGRLMLRNGGAFLPMAYREGSPTHPAYPAGHASVAGACCTVLKAFFNEAAVFASPVIASADGSNLNSYSGSDLTVGGELNKLASNIALGRDWAGVHYRSDGIDGLLVGEQQAIGLLSDLSRTYNETFDGFTLTKFDGSPLRIRNGTTSTS
ncbi:MAG: vanadium-dependent haloperoxidase [Pseudomonadota bacterium]